MKRKLTLVGLLIALTFSLTVCKGGGGGGGNAPQNNGGGTALTASAGWDRTVASGWAVTLDASKLTSSSGGSLTYQWTLLSGPTATLSDATASKPTFTAPVVDGVGEKLVFGLLVTESSGLTATSSVSVRVVDSLGPDPTTSSGLIDKALQQGFIDSETALKYRIFAIFGDTRLPVEFQRTNSEKVDDGLAVFELVTKFSSLSADNQTILAPFLKRPNASNSWYYLKTRANYKVLARPAGVVFHPVVTTNGKVTVWWPDDLLDGQLKADELVSQIDSKIWGALSTLMNREPPSDGALADNGGDATLDIYLLSALPGAAGLTHALPGYAVPGIWPSYIEIDGSMPVGSDTSGGILNITAHELMHAWQFSYKWASNNYADYAWLQEATAAWTEDFVYPNASDSSDGLPDLSEHRYSKWYLDTMNLPLDDVTNFRHYGEYLLFEYLTNQTFDSTFVRKVWEKTETLDSRKAVDEAVPTDYPFVNGATTLGFWSFWGDFLEAAWNPDINGWFWVKDQMARMPKPVGGAPVTANAMGGGKVYKLTKKAIPHLSANYYHYIFDFDAKAVFFYDGLRSIVRESVTDDTADGGAGSKSYYWDPLPSSDTNKGAEVRILGKINGEWKPYPFLYGVKNFCRDKADEKLEELVIILADSDLENTVQSVDQPSLLQVSDIGCRRWQGTVTMNAVNNGSDCDRSITAVVTLESSTNSLALVAKTLSLQETVSGTIDSGFNGTCSCAGSANWNYTAGVDPEEPFRVAHLEFAYTTFEGPAFRSYVGMGGSGTYGAPTPRGSYTVTCPDSGDSRAGTFPEYISNWFITWDESDPNLLTYVDAGGMTISGQNGIYSWTFTSSPDP